MSLLLLAQASCQSLTSPSGLREQPTSVSLVRYANIAGKNRHIRVAFVRNLKKSNLTNIQVLYILEIYESDS
ncbi:hypothetical protein EHR08_17195 [Leptospira bandrabouensis]|uniref:Uncharacterized protein n=1 Tax=Leptospira bandrabouensis TaxID=2484903 RepID=A0A6H3NL21_9LEPT|nr:hypothetical protein EHR07_01410 [Leptospira bandrabouensis]TGN11580.1 hypothetical protein EHR08_17195 [Leptospira bandrabouensis]